MIATETTLCSMYLYFHIQKHHTGLKRVASYHNQLFGNVDMEFANKRCTLFKIGILYN